VPAVQTTRTRPVACEPAGVTLETFEARIAEKIMLKHLPKMAEIANAVVLNCTCGVIAD
jgi:hypothetical protein